MFTIAIEVLNSGIWKTLTYSNRQQAERAARRLERRGYNTYVQLSREVGRRNG